MKQPASRLANNAAGAFGLILTIIAIILRIRDVVPPTITDNVTVIVLAILLFVIISNINQAEKTARELRESVVHGNAEVLDSVARLAPGTTPRAGARNESNEIGVDARRPHSLLANNAVAVIGIPLTLFVTILGIINAISYEIISSTTLLIIAALTFVIMRDRRRAEESARKLRDSVAHGNAAVLEGVARLAPGKLPETSVSNALNEISAADPSNILQVAAAQFKLSDQYYENVLSQAKRSFNSAVAAAVTGTLLFLAAITFAFISRQTSAAVISSTAGGIVEIVSGLNFWLYARTAIQLNSFHSRLERMQRYLVANSVAASLSAKRKEAALGDLVKTIAEYEH